MDKNGRLTQPWTQTLGLLVIVATLGWTPGNAVANESPIKVEGDVVAPKLVHHVNPNYPESAKTDQVSGSVVLRLTINQEGEVEEASVVKPLLKALDENAVEAALQWRWEPATLAGRPVSVFHTVAIKYELTETINYRAVGTVDPPKVLHRVAPVIPKAARRSRLLKGRVLFQLLIDETGQVNKINQLTSIREDIDQAALEAIQQWRFAPATDQGEPVAAIHLVDITFKVR